MIINIRNVVAADYDAIDGLIIDGVNIKVGAGERMLGELLEKE